MIVKIARCTQKNLQKIAAEKGVAQLLTIPYSHYCEFARWSLEANQVPYHEHSYSPGAHVLPALALRVSGRTKYLSDSSKVQPVGKPSPKIHPTAVPAVAMPNGRVLVDSWQAAESLFPTHKVKQIKDLKEFLDQRIGPLSRQMVYIALFQPQNDNIWDALCYEDGGSAFRVFWRLGLKRWLTNRMQQTFQTNNLVEKGRCLESIISAFEHVDKVWLDGADEYLGGTEPCMEDYALASLSAPVILPTFYCGGQYTHLFDKLLKQDEEFSSVVYRLRNTKCGKHTLKMYERHRSRMGLRSKF